MNDLIEFVVAEESDDSIALAVGRVALASTQLDYWACHVIAVSLGDSDGEWKRWFGQTGDRLIAGLLEAGEREARVLALVEPMRSVVLRRNQVVHGLVFADPDRGPDAYEFVRPLRKSVISDDRAITLQDLATLNTDIGTLDAYCTALHMALKAPVEYGTRRRLEPVLVRLPSLEGIADREWPRSED